MAFNCFSSVNLRKLQATCVHDARAQVALFYCLQQKEYEVVSCCQKSRHIYFLSSLALFPLTGDTSVGYLLCNTMSTSKTTDNSEKACCMQTA